MIQLEVRTAADSERRISRSVAAVLTAAALLGALYLGPVGWWPWDHDEVHSLMELGLIPIDHFPGPPAQLARMHRLVPVWTAMQRSALRVLPHDEWGSRLLPATCGAAAALLAFAVGRLRGGPWFGWMLLLLGGASPMLLWLSQQGRFYPVAFLWLTLSCVAVCVPSHHRLIALVLTVVFAACAVLSHNLTVVAFLLACAATWIGGPGAGFVSSQVRLRATAAAAVAGLMYLVYLRPLLDGWVSGDTGGTHPLVSLVAQLGVPVVALTMIGVATAFQRTEHATYRCWVTLLGLNVLFIGASERLMANWNPRYALFFMPPFWILAALGAATVAERLAERRLRAAWLVCVLVLLTPKLASHYIDGSRHDFRTAAALIARQQPGAAVVSNWPATLQYYLEPLTGRRVAYWSPRDPAPRGPFVLVLASNAWEPVLRIPGRVVERLGSVGRRRLDEQSYQVRIYRVE